MNNSEPLLILDREPIATRITFRYNGGIKTKEDYLMTYPELASVSTEKINYVAYIIQHTEDFPSTGEITIDSARNIIQNAAPHRSVPKLLPEELVKIWNVLIHDPEFMKIE